MILIGLTGGIACGKSTVCSILERDYDIYVIDSDRVVRQLQAPGSACVRSIARRWPSCVDANTGTLDRGALGHIVFSDPSDRRELGRIMNRPIFVAIMKQVWWLWWRDLWNKAINRSAINGTESMFSPCTKRCRVVIIDAPLLFETNIFTRFISGALVVACSESKQVQRLCVRNGYSEKEALDRIYSQMPLTEKRKLGDYVIENDGADIEALHELVKGSVAWMESRSGSKLSWMAAAAMCAVSSATIVIAFLLARRLGR